VDRARVGRMAPSSEDDSPHHGEWRPAMTIIFSTLAAAFGAFCVWLTVRIVNRRERWAKLTAVFVIVVLGYPLSYPAVLRVDAEVDAPNWAVDVMVSFYTPAFIAIRAAPSEIGNWYFDYHMQFMPAEPMCGIGE